tara:strand:- start:12839 stop:13864 length:1026 start_codon:yes stop_codon:yes gene_type:complete
MVKKKIIIIGNIGAKVSGSSLSFKRFYEKLISLNSDNIIFINTFRNRNNFLSNALKSFSILIKMFFIINNCKIISFNSDERAFIFFGPIVYIFAKLFRKKIVSRVFGGSLDVHYERSTPIIKLFFRNTIMKSDTVFLQTNLLMNYFSELNYNLKKLPTSRRAINKKIKFKKKASKYIFLGRISDSKGIKYLNDAVEDLDLSISVDLYGSVEDKELLTLINNNPKIRYKGYIDHDNIYETLSAYDVLILPTFYEGEGYPGAIIEAYQCGIPVIVTKWRSIPEIVDKTCGIIVPIKSSTEIKGAIHKLYYDSVLYQNLQKGAQIKSLEFDEEKWFKVFHNELL